MPSLAKVSDLIQAVRASVNVPILDVPMDQPVGVQGQQAGEHLLGEVPDLPVGEEVLFVLPADQFLSDVPAVAVLHHDVQIAISL